MGKDNTEQNKGVTWAEIIRFYLLLSSFKILQLAKAQAEPTGK